jgi:hypothetical protein
MGRARYSLDLTAIIQKNSAGSGRSSLNEQASNTQNLLIRCCRGDPIFRCTSRELSNCTRGSGTAMHVQTSEFGLPRPAHRNSADVRCQRFNSALSSGRLRRS